jgi:hypothetical protein
MNAKWILAAVIAAAAGQTMAQETKPLDTAQEVRTETYVQKPPAHFHEVDADWMKKFHNPMEGVEMGLDLRLREVYSRNMFTVSDSLEGDRHYQRIRSRWSLKWALDEDIDFRTRLTWEFWNWCKPEGFRRSTEFDEAIFDHFNLQFRNAFDLPLTLTVGRQDIILGTGWLVLDGTPADGSRTIFFDAIRAEYQVSDTSKLDLIYIQQYDNEDEYIKPFNHGAVRERRRLTQKGDEKGFIFYWTNKLNDAHSNELYYMYKNDRDSEFRQRYQAAAAAGQNADIHTIGTRFFGNLDENWSYSAEMAKQFGKRDSASLQALGTNNKLMYAFKDELKNQLHVGYEYMSGNDPDSSADEEFDTMWGDWPQFQRGGDLQSYIWTREGATGEVSNLHRLGIGHSFKPNDVWTIATDYNLLWADENSESGTAGYSSGDNFRGHMLSALATYQCCKKFKTQFLLDYFIPGSYYASPSGDEAFFARMNVEWTF